MQILRFYFVGQILEIDRRIIRWKELTLSGTVSKDNVYEPIIWRVWTDKTSIVTIKMALHQNTYVIHPLFYNKSF